MAHAVAAALTERSHCLAEAGTGVGKTFAYLVPALLLLRGNRKAVVSTHTINLQEQLTQKDIPALRSALPELPFRSALLKGMSNYLCLQNMDGAARLDLVVGDDYARLSQWASHTATGDLSELGFTPSGWGEVCASAESCRRHECRYFDRCFLYQARRDAAAADLVVVNHALYCSDLALRQVDPALSLLPKHDAVLFDEAHHLEEVAGRAYGAECSSYRVTMLVARLRRLRFAAPNPRALDRLEDANKLLFDMLAQGSRPESVLQEALADCGAGNVAAAADDLASRLEWAAETLTESARDVPDEDARAHVEGYGRTATRIRDELLAILSHAGDNHVAWLERTPSRRRVQVVLHLTPITVSEYLRPALWEGGTPAVLTSATLATGGSFDYLRERLGLPSAREAIVGSPFDYRRQALLYVAAHLDPPSESPAYQEAVIREIRQILEMTRGRAFVLFTSYRALARAYDAIAPEITFPCLRQGEASNAHLIEEFRSTPNACLFGVQSFWEGVDVPGDALSCVIIDRLPFAVPNHPVHQARVQAIRDAGGDWFNDYALPQAQIRLKQGFGRLIRTHTDTGIVCILDSRLARKAYGRSFLQSLPRCTVTTRMPEIARFLASTSPETA